MVADRYRLVYRLDGSDSRFKALDQRLDREVTVCFSNLDVESAELIQGSGDRRAASSLHHPALEPLFDVGYDLGAASTFLVTSYEPSSLLQHQPPSGALGTAVLAELSSLLQVLHQEGLGHSLLTPRHVRVVSEEVDSGVRLRVPFTGLYLDGPRRGLAEDLGDLARLALPLLPPARFEADAASEPLRQVLISLANGSVEQYGSATEQLALLQARLADSAAAGSPSRG